MATPTSIVSLPLQYLKATIAASAAFQGLVGAANEAAAMAFVHIVSVPGTVSPPYAVVDVMTGTWEARAGGTRKFFEQFGTLEFQLRAAISDSSDAEQGNEAVDFLNTAGEILEDMLQLAGTPGYLAITGARHALPARPTREARRGVTDFYELVFQVDYESAAP